MDRLEIGPNVLTAIEELSKDWAQYDAERGARGDAERTSNKAAFASSAADRAASVAQASGSKDDHEKAAALAATAAQLHADAATTQIGVGGLSRAVHHAEQAAAEATRADSMGTGDGAPGRSAAMEQSSKTAHDAANSVAKL